MFSSCNPFPSWRRLRAVSNLRDSSEIHACAQKSPPIRKFHACTCILHVCCTMQKCTMLSGNLKKSHNDKTFIELACSVHTGRTLVLFFFCKFMDLARGSVHKFAKQSSTNIFPVFSQYGPHASSITSIYGTLVSARVE